MKRNTQLSDVLHLLVHMAQHGEPMTSEQMAACLQSHAVVVRRLLARLRDAQLVESTRGHGGGWQLARAPEAISLYHVYVALGEPLVLGHGVRGPHPDCAIERAVNDALDDGYRQAQAALAAQLQALTLRKLGQRVQRKLKQEQKTHAT
ncbi:Putative HTH-type transcriptional regulator YwnA [Xanthomonas sp. SS]|uniref:Rrf2 family transcriptional regulator n=1 Tax=Xanthomonas sp. SS TaxID=2724122 RepID=UPI00163A8229|nr:Rrf2 family transcriptional regulator [Xanthomonas sp. SS]QNH15193.1 Putative HTH-type transcriptional regulator YwnA [Xanthomonas sp. SS]